MVKSASIGTGRLPESTIHRQASGDDLTYPFLDGKDDNIMRCELNKSSIVLVGAWNARIFTPQWIAVNEIVGADQEVTVEITFGVAPFHSRLKFNRVLLQLSDDKLTLIPTEDTDQAFEDCREAAHKIVGLLPHTPLAAMGINRYYECDGLALRVPELAKAFNFEDEASFGKHGWNVGARSIKRVIEKEGYEANFTIEQSENGVIGFGFNFHYTGRNAAQILEVLAEKRASDFTDAAKGFLSNIYGVDLNEE